MPFQIACPKCKTVYTYPDSAKNQTIRAQCQKCGQNYSFGAQQQSVPSQQSAAPSPQSKPQTPAQQPAPSQSNPQTPSTPSAPKSPAASTPPSSATPKPPAPNKPPVPPLSTMQANVPQPPAPRPAPAETHSLDVSSSFPAMFVVMMFAIGLLVGAGAISIWYVVSKA